MSRPHHLEGVGTRRDSRPTSRGRSIRTRSAAPAYTNVCSLSCCRCAPSTARSRAAAPSTACAGMPFAWSLNPYMGCAHRCTFCYVRAFEARADRPCGRPLRREHPGQDERRRGAAAGARARRPGSASRSRSARRPIRTSRPRAATGSRARCIEALAEAVESVLDHHARAADRPRRRRARRGGPARRASRSRSPSRRSTTRSGAAPSRARRRRASGCARCRGSSRPASTRASGWRRSCPG